MNEIEDHSQNLLNNSNLLIESQNDSFSERGTFSGMVQEVNKNVVVEEKAMVQQSQGMDLVRYLPFKKELPTYLPNQDEYLRMRRNDPNQRVITPRNKSGRLINMEGIAITLKMNGQPHRDTLRFVCYNCEEDEKTVFKRQWEGSQWNYNYYTIMVLFLLIAIVLAIVLFGPAKFAALGGLVIFILMGVFKCMYKGTAFSIPETFHYCKKCNALLCVQKG